MVSYRDTSDDIVMETKVDVTYHKMELFKNMFSDYSDFNLKSLHNSLCPKYNREMVFKSGEGAGRSGSFFFFSHDRKWIIKTMTKGEKSLYLSKIEKFA